MLEGETKLEPVPEKGHKRNISLRPHNLWGMLEAENPPETLPTKFVKRVALFKIPKEGDIETTLREYNILRDTAVKVGSNSVLRVVKTDYLC